MAAPAPAVPFADSPLPKISYSKWLENHRPQVLNTIQVYSRSFECLTLAGEFTDPDHESLAMEASKTSGISDGQLEKVNGDTFSRTSTSFSD